MPIRVAVPLRDRDSGAEGGISLVVAAAKLLTYEFHEAALQAKSNDISYDARTDDTDAVIERYLLVRGTDGMEGPQLFLAGELESQPDYVSDVRASVGHFAEDIQLFSLRPEALHAATDLSQQTLEEFADEAGFVMPRDWERRLGALQKKHLPPPVFVVEEQPMPVRSQHRCACGNYAAGAGGECNACKRQRAISAAEALATRLSEETAKRARVSSPSSALLRV